MDTALPFPKTVLTICLYEEIRHSKSVYWGNSTGIYSTLPITSLKTPLKGTKALIIELLTKQPGTTQESIAIQTGKSIYTIKEHFKWLKDNKQISRIGTDKAGYLFIIND